jgi:hypothetical protein
VDDADPAGQVQRRRKTQRQYSNWVDNIIPSLLPLYLHLLCEAESFRPSLQTNPVTCCCTSFRSLSVTCVYFQCKFCLSPILALLTPAVGLDSINIKVCACATPAAQLLVKGLFPCAPNRPSLAIDISLLQFTRSLFVRLPPNMTFLTETIESFLDSRGYQLEGQVMSFLHRD